MAEKAGCVLKGKKKTHRFYAKILDNPDHHSKLQIPEKFVADHGSQLPEKSAIRLPSGEEWPVKMARNRKKAWFDEGWKEFASFNSLGPSHSLMFEYDGHGHFLVFIFDTSASEIDYKPNQSNVHVKEEYGELSAGETLEKPNKRGKSPLASPQPKKLRTGNEKQVLPEDEDEDKNREETSRKGRAMTNVAKACYLARAKDAFTSQNPFFMLVIQPSYLVAKERLFLQRKFIAKHFKDEQSGIFLRHPDGDLQKFEYSVNKRRATFSAKSWSIFAQINCLEVGDVCVFEKVEGDRRPTLNVVIIRAHQDGHSPGSTSGNQAKLATFKAANAFTSNQPLFKVAVSQLNLYKGRVHIPTEFWKHISVGTREAELWYAGECWGVRILHRTFRSLKVDKFLSGGWKAFAKANSLKVGDVCVYEVIKEEADEDARSKMMGMIKLRVRIFRG